MRGGLRGGRARLQPAEPAEEPDVGFVERAARAARERFGAERHGDVEGAADFHPEKRRRRDADSRVGVTVERHGAPDCRRGSAIFVLPEPVTDHRRRRLTTAPVIVCCEHASNERRHFERREKVAARPQAERVARFPAGGEVERRRAIGKRVRKHLLVVANLFPQRIRQHRPASEKPSGPAPWRVGDTNFYELLRIFHRQRTQPHRVEQLKDRSVGAGAERQREDGDGGETGVDAEQPRPVFQIAPRAVDKSHSHSLPEKNDGSGRSRIVCSPGDALSTCGIEFTTIEAVATSPWIPPASFIDSRGDPSISTAS